MTIDRVARAAQVGRIIAHAGEPFTWSDGVTTIFAAATVAPWTPEPTEANRDLREVGNAVLVCLERALFGAKLPRKGQHFTDEAGRNYRILGPVPLPPSSPMIKYVCSAPVA